MKRISKVVSPVLVLALTALWLLLNQTLALAQLAFGVVLALVLAWSASALRPLRAHMRRLDIAAGLFFVVLYDIVRSSLAVAWLVLAPARARRVHSGFLRIPLDLRDPHGLAALAIIVTSTPGTVWAGLSSGGDSLRLHVLDLEHPAEWVRLFKERYEQPLMRIFQ